MELLSISSPATRWQDTVSVLGPNAAEIMIAAGFIVLAVFMAWSLTYEGREKKRAARAI